jgi:branched-chain amino acid transport system permease protein
MGTFIQLLVIGLSMGMIYAIVAMSIDLLVKAVGVLNFAQGDLLMVGAYVTFCLTYQLNLPFYAMFILALIIFAIFGAIFMFTVYWPLRKSKWPATNIIMALGASIVIKEICKLIWGSIPLVSDPIMKGVLVIGTARLEYQYLFIIGAGLILLIGVVLLYDKLYVGRVMQAAAQDKYSAELLGIPTILTIVATYMISMLLVGIGGYLVAPLFLVSTKLSSFLLKGFSGMVVGGIGNIKGAVLGSLLIGVTESFSTLFTSYYKDSVAFLVLILVLIIRPQGIFGQRISEKA